ncbi:MAG TPA: sigma 54-interacting transcriptional regulator, partial [Pirellulales bacterium]
IGDMAPGTQAKMLRVLQDQTFERVGGNETIHTNVRVVAATNQNLETLVAAGKFRQDLLYRLNGFTIKLPPLRERMEDLPALVDYFIQRSNKELSKHVRGATAEALDALKQHSWPGNVRELQGAVRYAVVQSLGDFLRVDDLPASIGHPHSVAPTAVPAIAAASDSLNVPALVRKLLSDGAPDLYERVLAAVDRVVLEEVLRAVQGNQVAAAEKLGMARNTLRSKLKALGLTVEKHLGPASPDATSSGDE